MLLSIVTPLFDCRTAGLAAPVARIGGAALVRSAAALVDFAPNLAYRIFVLAVGLTDLSGYCAASAREASERSETPVPA